MIVTAYTKTVRRRATGRTETVACAYSTKSLTPMHEHIRKTYPGATTYRDPKRVITHLVPGWPLPHMPIVTGGEVIA